MDKKINKDEKPNLKYQREKDREPVKGIFRFYEVPGGSLSFVFRKYLKDPIERFDMVDGQMYKVPLGVAKHLNNNGWYPVHRYTLNEQGNSSMRIGERKRRFGFSSLEFTSIEELNVPDKEIITVDQVTPEAHSALRK